MRCEIRALPFFGTEGGMVQHHEGRFREQRLHCLDELRTRHVPSEPSHLAVLRLHTLNEDEEGRDVLAQLRRLPPAIRFASVLARTPGVDVHPRISSRHRQANAGFQRTHVLRTDVHPFHHTFLREEQARELKHAHLPVAKPHDITPGYPSEDTSWNAAPQNSPTTFFRESPGSSPPLSSEDIGERLKPSRRCAIRVKKRGGHTHAKPVGADAKRTKYSMCKMTFSIFQVP